MKVIKLYQYVKHKKENVNALFLLPNIVTLCSLLCGCYAVMSAIDGQFNLACRAVLVGMVCDFLDGLLARLTHTTTDFGAQLDSLADLVTFGVAPSVIVMEWQLRDLHQFWPFLSFIWICSVSIRLARFNSQKIDLKFFSGLPCPAAAALIVGYVGTMNVYDVVLPQYLNITITVALIFLGSLAMVSSVPFQSLKAVKIARHKQLLLSFFVVTVVAVAIVKPFETVLIISSCYVLYSLFRVFKPKRSPCKD